jgi:exonuclease SbcC
MRLHELSVTAFGPFVETIHVDFDELAAGGLFLLTGDTGAGKTSVLDAVCFALYGEVPGDRHSARHLRSDHADPEAEPRVVLRVSIGDRMFRFTRSPAWQRPKRRGGAGTTKVQAHVLVEEHRSGNWVALTNRLDEAGHLVTGLLGMTCTQFTQVAMLPQGRFQSFLRATSAERHAVLQRLFRTRRFEEVERWLVERRLTLRRQAQICQERVAGVVNRIQEAAGVGVPQTWDLHDLDPVLEEGLLLSWAVEHAESSATTASSLEHDLTTATQLLNGERAACDHGRQLSEARSRGERARRTLIELEATADVEESLVQSIERHHRASSVLPLVLRAETAAEAAGTSEVAAMRHLAVVAPLLGITPGEVRPATLAEAATRANEARAVAEAWLPRETQLHDERARLRALSAQMAHLEDQISKGDAEHACLGVVRERLLPQLSETRALAGRCDAHRLAVEAADAGLAAARQLMLLTAELTDARHHLEEATEHAQALRDRYQDLRERRISGMAAELAIGLAAGCSCPVCGSAEHPSPAMATGRVSRSDEDAARQDYETADFERQAVQDSVVGLRTRIDGARARSQGLDEEQWQQRFDEATHALDDSLEASGRVRTLEAELVTVGDRDRELAAALARDRATRAAKAQQLAESESRVEQLRAELRELLAPHPGADSVAALVEAQARSVKVLEEAQEVLTRHERATHELTHATTAARAAAEAEGFDSLSQALAAVLSGGEAASRSKVLDTRRAARSAATSVLEEDDVANALDQPAPDLGALSTAVRAAEVVRDKAHAAHQQAAARATRLESLVGDLRREVASWEPVRLEHALAAGLASLVEGRSADNQLKMRLSAYVLSERLRQVVAAANERLGDMTDQRYALEQADEKGAGEQRGGLSLRVRDEWSGKHRDPATLSGGETFLVSLALALGLADTVTHEAGGTQLDTLFIDEGFGALDAATLDGVMDTLDSLRDGGRVVGLVSHVAELRNRVPSQLEIRKARRGSTVCASVTIG